MKDMLTSQGVDVRKLRLKADFVAAMHSSNLTSLVEPTATSLPNSSPAFPRTKKKPPLSVEAILHLFETATKEYPNRFVKRNIETEWKVSEHYPPNTHF